MKKIKTKKQLESAGFVIVSRDMFPTSEKTSATKPWEKKDYTGNVFYNASQHWSEMIARHVKASKAKSVFEYGCSVGRNLLAIKELCPDVEVSGCDVSPSAVAYAREKDLNVILAGPDFPETLTRNSRYDMVLTVSLLDHVPDPERYLEVFSRISSKEIMLLEIRLPAEGRIGRYLNQLTGMISEPETPTYSWHYEKMLRKLKKIKSCGMTDYSLEGVASGPHYKLFIAKVR